MEKPKIKFVENNIKETKILTLNSNKAKKLLEWEPSWNTRKSIKMTSDWYKQFYNDPRQVNKLSLMQLEDWRSDNFKFKYNYMIKVIEKPMKILTGSTGFIGNYLINLLLKNKSNQIIAFQEY